MNTSMHHGAGDLAPDSPLAPAGMVNLSRLSVLIADGDTAQSRRTLDLLLGLEVRDVICVQDRDSALEWLRSRAFDVLLCSTRLGEHDGVELVRMARQVSPATRPVLLRPHSRAALPDGIETLERPFSSAKLKGLLSRAAAPLGGLWCEVPQLSLADILQMYHQGRRSITVLLSGPIAGRIRLVEGEIVHAESDTLEGLPALSRLLEADSGLLRTETATGDGPRTVQGAFESTILAALQLLDERHRDRASATAVAPSRTLNEPRPGSVPSPSPDFAEGLPAPRSKLRPLIFALGVALVLGVVTLVFIGRNTEVSNLEPMGARPADVQSDVRGLAADDSRQPAAQAPANPLIADASAPASPSESRASFELTLSSKPGRAKVLEGGKLLGRTPLALPIEKESVLRAPREFTLQLPGHEPRVVRQGSSTQDVEAEVVLRPLATVDTAVPAPDKVERRSTPRGRRPNLDIRLRR